MNVWYYSNYYKGQKNEPSKAKWYAFQGKFEDFLKYLLDNWDAQPKTLFSHRVGISGIMKKIAKTSEVDQLGVVRRDEDGILKYFEDCKPPKIIGNCKRVPEEAITEPAH